jgi:hypothetical protein
MEVQAQIPSALVALHNFILDHDSLDIERYLQEDVTDELPGQRRYQEVDYGSLARAEKVSAAEKKHAEDTRERISRDMWTQYVEELERRFAEQMDVDIERLPVD